MTALNLERLKELLVYHPETGDFTWRVRRGSQSCAGTLAGKIDRGGYRSIKIDYRSYLAHRLAWMYCHGCMPIGEIDHIDRNKLNNRIHNLRIVTRHENMQNITSNAKNTSGYRGVTWHAKGGRWQAQIKAFGAVKYLGLFESADAAYAAYCSAAADLKTKNPHASRSAA